MRCDLTDTHTDIPNYSNLRYVCVPRVNKEQCTYLHCINALSNTTVYYLVQLEGEGSWSVVSEKASSGVVEVGSSAQIRVG